MPIHIMEMRQEPRRFRQIANSLHWDECFNLYSGIFQALGVDYQIATDRMIQNYEQAVSVYTDEYIKLIFTNNYYANAKKYAELLALYDSDIDIFSPVSMTESYTDLRTPNLSSSSSSTGSGSTQSSTNQSRTSTTTPATTTTNIHSVNPYDDTGLRTETQDATSETGTRTTVESYSGQPDSMTSSSTASSTVTSTGTETIKHDLTRSGRDGRFSISEIIDQAEESAQKLNILDMILEDIANQILIQTWIL